ncbi:hypothetical protein PIROE2DRAFT_14132 [Piromyces sp. E2]|nr:hypothetical protein PIROE2DRAFT_14132 [Piromyces sp. E2]|eukprot:OUM60180.1 hypothetical protein PIROE2DRAFT_14132 [Piromyces sp. E2]
MRLGHRTSKNGNSHLMKKTDTPPSTTITVTATSSKNNSKTVLNSENGYGNASGPHDKSRNDNKNSHITLNQLKPKSYYRSDPENINSSTACILSQYTNIKPQYSPNINNNHNHNNNVNINSSSHYMDHNFVSRSNLCINTMGSNLMGIYSRSSYNIDGGGMDHNHNHYLNQIRRGSNMLNGSNVYNYTQSTSNLNASNDQLIHSYRRNEFSSNRLYPKNSNLSSMDSGLPPPLPLQHHQQQHQQQQSQSRSIIDSLNLDFISMENLASEKMLQKQQTNQSLLYNLDLCVNDSMKSSLFSLNSNSVNSLFSKKTVTSYILISRRPIFSVMQKCLLEMYLLSKYSLQKNKYKNKVKNKMKNDKENKMKTGVMNPKLLKEGIMESFLAYLMHTIFLPSINSPFIVEIELPLSKEIVQVLPQNKIEIKPLYHPVFTLFQLLSINNIISIFTHMTLEKSVIFYSENPSILTAIW